MSRSGELIQALRDLGLTPTEAEVYVATLEVAADGPVSGYRVAQNLGRDPANLAKVMASLVRQGAVRVVQQKPRLYRPVAPDAFTEAVVTRLQERREQALDLLRSFAGAEEAPAPRAVGTFAEAVAAATGLVAGARRSVLLYASADAAASLAAPLAAAAGRSGCRVAVLCPEPVGPTGGEAVLVPAPADADASWLQLVCDRRAWLVARAGAEPAGCGGEQAGTAAVLADALDVARRAAGLTAERAALAAAAGGDARPAAPPRPAPGPAREGLTFLIRHDEEKNHERD